MTDQDLLISRLRKAGRMIGDHLEPGPRSEQMLMRLIEVLDSQDLASAIERLEAAVPPLGPSLKAKQTRRA